MRKITVKFNKLQDIENLKKIMKNVYASNSDHLPDIAIVNSGEFGARSDGATPISNRRATSDNAPNFSSIDYKFHLGGKIFTPSQVDKAELHIIRVMTT